MADADYESSTARRFTSVRRFVAPERLRASCPAGVTACAEPRSRRRSPTAPSDLCAIINLLFTHYIIIIIIILLLYITLLLYYHYHNYYFEMRRVARRSVLRSRKLVSQFGETCPIPLLEETSFSWITHAEGVVSLVSVVTKIAVLYLKR